MNRDEDRQKALTKGADERHCTRVMCSTNAEVSDFEDEYESEFIELNELHPLVNRMNGSERRGLERAWVKSNAVLRPSWYHSKGSYGLVFDFTWVKLDFQTAFSYLSGTIA